MKIFAFHSGTPDIRHNIKDDYLVNLKVPKNLTLEQAWVRSEPDNEGIFNPLKVISTDNIWITWQGELRLNTAEDVTLYCFKFLIQGIQYWLDATGEIKRFFPERDLHFRFNPHYKAATWVWSQIFYQIFPERFYDGDPSNNVKDADYLYEGKPVVSKAWNELPDRRQGPREFYGGDLEGIRQKLPYLKDLGITALYLNPIFESPSSHKYDTVNFYDIDKHFGTKETFAQLCDNLRSLNMRLLLDAVVNHTSERHIWFDRYDEYEQEGAYQSKNSPTREFYSFESEDPESYHGWCGVKTLPVLDYQSEKLKDIVYRSNDAILRYWMRPPYQVDGWRFDVIHMLGEGSGAKNNAEYVRHFRQTLREENNEAFMLGEHFFEASKWLQGDQEDGAMNYYGFTQPLWAFLAGKDVRNHSLSIDAQDFEYMLTRARARLAFEHQLSQFNLLGSHDTPRFLTFVKGDIALMKIAVTFLFTYIGVPCIYYGDEIGMEGEQDPDCRRPFCWDERSWNKDLKHHFETLIAFRKAQKVLQEGAFLGLFADADIYVFARVSNTKSILTLINRGQEKNIYLDVWKLGLSNETLRSLFSQETYVVLKGSLELTVPAKSSLVLY